MAKHPKSPFDKGGKITTEDVVITSFYIVALLTLLFVALDKVQP